MQSSADSSGYFQTSDSIADAARKKAKKDNAFGAPIQLASKLLAVISDPDKDNSVYVAEAAGNVRRVNIEDGKSSKSYSGPQAPVTCLALSPTPPSSSSPRILFAGCWDKSIYSWSTTTSTRLTTYRTPAGHTDFLKALATVSLTSTSTSPPTSLLISGAADSKILIWNIATGSLLYSLTGHTRGILSLAIDPASLPPYQTTPSAPAVLVSSDSTREIREWTLSATEGKHIGTDALTVHETSISQVYFPSVGQGADLDDPPDLYTASADKRALCLTRPVNDEELRGDKTVGATRWSAVDLDLEHPDFVRAVLVSVRHGVIVTACRDENVRVWDSSSGELVHTYAGHWEEVTGLALARKGGSNGAVSVSIDGTVRWWGLGKEDFEKSKEEEARWKNPSGEEVEVTLKKDATAGDGLLTEEEEAELAALMEDSD